MNPGPNEPRPRAAPCPELGFQGRCEGNVRVACREAFEDKEDCGAQGKCVVATEPDLEGGLLAACLPGDGCDIQPACRGNRAAFCDGKEAVSYDCAGVGMVCEAEGGHSQCGWPNAP